MKSLANYAALAGAFIFHNTNYSDNLLAVTDEGRNEGWKAQKWRTKKKKSHKKARGK